MPKLTLGLLLIFAAGLALTGWALDPGSTCTFVDGLDNCVRDSAAEAVQATCFGLALTCLAGAVFTFFAMRASKIGAPNQGFLD